jgi:hypothetical protein
MYGMNNVDSAGDHEMSRALRGVFASVLALALLSGCASGLPPPTSGAGEATLSMDLPAQFAEGQKIPPRVEGKIDFSFESKAIQADPDRSRFDGKITLVITDPQKTHQYLDFTATLNGEYDGPPNEGWSRAAAQASDLVALFYKGLQKPETESKPH